MRRIRVTARGSSPLSRGIPVGFGVGGGVVRIIPALAGNTRAVRGGRAASWDHPRSRGEYPLRGTPRLNVRGSSPLSRGILPGMEHLRRRAGIIPALAGNTTVPPPERFTWTDHPRSRGEYKNLRSRLNSYLDHPRSRGEYLIQPHDHYVEPWIIPALAGNTGNSCLYVRESWDHPRSRGEYVAIRVTPGRVEGSSPLSRGIQVRAMLEYHREGIIPALAGNTVPSDRPSSVAADHPRSRGEYFPCDRRRQIANGSSPLSRGIRSMAGASRGRQRIIPALAGNTLVDKGFYQPDLSDLGNPLLARLRFSKSLAPRLRRPPSWRGGSSGSASEGPGRTIRVSPS